MKNKTLLILAIVFLASFSSRAQTDGVVQYTLEQSVIASGGGQNSTGGTFTLDGTIGQPAAGTRSTNAPFAVTGGFWAANALAPTVATISIGGRVLTTDGAGLRNARVTLIDANGNSRTVLSGVRGGFRFAEVAAGETYIISVAARRYVFAPQVFFAGEDLDNLIFTAVGQTGGGSVLLP